MSEYENYETKRRRKLDAVKEAETQGTVADSMAARLALIKRMDAGEITLEEAQAEIARLKRTAKRSGLITRDQAYRRG